VAIAHLLELSRLITMASPENHSASSSYRDRGENDLAAFKDVASQSATQEIELQYIVPEALGSKLRKGHTPVLLTTHYFPKGSGAVEHAIKKTGFSELFQSLDTTALNTVRLRESIFSNGQNEYRLEFKGPKKSCVLGRVARSEFSFRMSQALFEKLLPEASGGTVVKLRYGIPGHVSNSDGTAIPILLELDQVLKAGGPPKRLGMALYRADIEIPTASLVGTNLVDLIRAGQSSFADVLDQSIELSALDREHAKTFSYSKLARWGLSDQMQRCYEKLLG
jgi:hypothetical protein